MQRVEKSIRVNAPVEKVYQYWRSFDNFPSFMEHVEDVRVTGPDGKRSHWKIKGPLGKTVEYDAEMTKDEPNKMIGWNSLGGDVETSGVVTFNELEHNNTEVHVVLQWYDTPAGAVGEAASRMLQNPEKMLEEDLQRFKDIVEGRVGSGLRRG
jgi:uncharacterized membrane protein